jgi:GntR family transcriptional regulator/MocR family aminotransferase
VTPEARQGRATGPGRVQWERLFALEPSPWLPLQTRLRQAIVQALLEGRLAAGAPMPSSRELARLLGLSRNTVTAAYDQLVDEGFLQARPRSGIFVAHAKRTADLLPRSAQPVHPPAVPTSGHAPDWSHRLHRSLARQPMLAKPVRWRDYPYPFVYGQHDPELFPTEDFRECVVRTLARARQPRWTPDFETDDVPELVEQIRLRLLPQRGVFALPDEILVTVGAQHAYHLLAEGLFHAETRVGLEEPGHPHARNTFSLRSPRMLAVPVDADGLVVDSLPPLDYLFVTPSHQSPTTVTLALERRSALLARAEREDFIVVEDDYEAENLHTGVPMPALKSLDRTGRVVYVGSLSKSLSPALRLAYIVAPRDLVAELRLLRHAMVRHPSTLLQQAYALFLALGHHESHARRVNAALRERTAALAMALREFLPDFSFCLPQGGASLWLQAPHWCDGAELSTIARGHGVLVEPGNVFFAAPPYPCPHLRLRLSSIPAAQIAAGVRALSLAVDELAAARGVVRTPTTPAAH